MEKRIKPYRGMGMEGVIARWYSSQTKRAISDFELLAQRVAERLPEHARVLELAPGPGYFAVELARLDNFQVTGLDISRTFCRDRAGECESRWSAGRFSARQRIGHTVSR